MGKFKEFLITEGDLLDAIKHGVKAGFKAYKEKRTEQKDSSDVKQLTKTVLNSEGKELQAAIRKIVNNGYTFSQGKVQKDPETSRITDWLKENVQAQGRHRSPQVGAIRFAGFVLS